MHSLAVKIRSMPLHGRFARISRLVCLAIALVACAPTLNWRTVTLPTSGATAMFPCRPDNVERPIRLADRETTMRLTACSVDGATFALAEVDVSDDSSANIMLLEIRARSTANIGGQERAPQAWVVKGPNRHAERIVVTGHWPDGAAVVEQRASLIANGKIYRLSVIGASPPLEAVNYFFAGFVVATR